MLMARRKAAPLPLAAVPRRPRRRCTGAAAPGLPPQPASGARSRRHSSPHHPSSASSHASSCFVAGAQRTWSACETSATAHSHTPAASVPPLGTSGCGHVPRSCRPVSCSARPRSTMSMMQSSFDDDEWQEMYVE
jgi:hypothetical protein